MDKRTFWIMGLFLVAFLGWTYYFQQNPDLTRPAGDNAPVDEAPQAASVWDQAVVVPAPNLPTKSVTVETPKYVAVFHERGGRLASFKLKNYSKRKVNPELPDELMELVAQPNRDDWSMRLEMSDPIAPDLRLAPFLADRDSINHADGQTGRLVMTYSDPNGLVVTRTLTFSADTYLVGQRVTLTNGNALPYEGNVTMRINTAPFAPDNERAQYLAGYLDNKLEEKAPKNARDALNNRRVTRADWVGFMDQYFLTALVEPGRSENPARSSEDAAEKIVAVTLNAYFQDHGGVAVNASRSLNLPPSTQVSYDFDFYYGPKEAGDLTAAGHNLVRSINFGYLDFLAKPLAKLLRILYGWVGNYGVAIIIVTILIKVLLWPLTAKSYRSMKSMQQLGPKVTKLREKYGDDKETMNREIMQLYKTYKVNPLGGCLPMLLQIPFFIAFYQVLYNLLDLRGAPFMLWIQDLAAPDRLGSFDFTIPLYAPPTGIPVLTILMGASMVLQQKMTPNTMGDPIQAKMMMLMPVFFTFILINFPAGLLLYWLVNNLLTIAQQKINNRYN